MGRALQVEDLAELRYREAGWPLAIEVPPELEHRPVGRPVLIGVRGPEIRVRRDGRPGRVIAAAEQPSGFGMADPRGDHPGPDDLLHGEPQRIARAGIVVDAQGLAVL